MTEPREPGEDPFIVEGIRRYAPALETLETFETMLGERLRDVLRNYTSPVFRPDKTASESGASHGKFGHVVWASQRGRLASRKETRWIEVGLWWRDGKQAYYCGLPDEDNKSLEFTYTRAHSRVEMRMWGPKPRLFMLARTDVPLDLDAEFKLLLDELLASV